MYDVLTKPVKNQSFFLKWDEKYVDKSLMFLNRRIKTFCKNVFSFSANVFTKSGSVGPLLFMFCRVYCDRLMFFRQRKKIIKAQAEFFTPIGWKAFFINPRILRVLDWISWTTIVIWKTSSSERFFKPTPKAFDSSYHKSAR